LNINAKEVIELGPDNHLATKPLQKKPVILVMTRRGHLTEVAITYSLSVAERLNHQLLVAYVNTMPLLWDGGCRSKRFAFNVEDNVAILKDRGLKKGVPISHVKESGNIGKVVSRLCRIVKSIEFIIVDDGVSIEKVVSRAPVPVFSIDKTVTN
jgi:hypothetical protein